MKRQGIEADHSEGGFTIVELMIALSILSIILVASTVILMQLGKLYSKGVGAANTQNATRNIINDIASQLQLSGETPDLSQAAAGVYCIGNQRYTFALNKELGSNPTDHGLWRDTTSGAAACAPVNLNAQTPSDISSVPNSGIELLSSHMRLSVFTIAINSNDTYTIKVEVAYGDDDLLCDNGTPGDCSSVAKSNHLAAPSGTIICKGGIGTEYCATSTLALTVGRRIVSE